MSISKGRHSFVCYMKERPFLPCLYLSYKNFKEKALAPRLVSKKINLLQVFCNKYQKTQVFVNHFSVKNLIIYSFLKMQI